MDEYPIMRHMCNLETVKTYEGTDHIHTLVIGETCDGHRGVQVSRIGRQSFVSAIGDGAAVSPGLPAVCASEGEGLHPHQGP